MIICTKKRCVWRVDCGNGKAVCHMQYCSYMRQTGTLPPKPPDNSSKWDAAIEILRNYARRQAMTNSEKKQRLGQYNHILHETDRLYDEIEKLQSIAEKVTAVLSREPRGSSVQERIAVVDDIIEEKHKLERELHEAFEERSKIIRAIDTVKDPLRRRILKWVYLNGRKWDDIAAHEKYSRNYLASEVFNEAIAMVEFEQ